MPMSSLFMTCSRARAHTHTNTHIEQLAHDLQSRAETHAPSVSTWGLVR